MKFFINTCLVFSCLVANLFGYVDLDKYPSDFVLDLKKIDIPGHPDAFNPSIVRWEGSLLMSFREVSKPCFPAIPSASESSIGLVWLDDDFNPISDAYMLDFGSAISRAEDPRLLVVGNDLCIVYSNNTEEVATDCGFCMWIAKLLFYQDEFYLYDNWKLAYLDGEQHLKREKNWVPFDFNGRLCLSYRISPHKVFFTMYHSEICYTLSESNTPVKWKWGELRGGTPAIDINGRYLSIFHSNIEIATTHSEGKVMPHYFMGAYLFSNQPPFEITHISSRPIIAKGFYSGEQYPYYWRPTQVVFPCGILAKGNNIWITYGRQDHEIWVAKLDRVKLLMSLSPVLSEK